MERPSEADRAPPRARTMAWAVTRRGAAVGGGAARGAGRRAQRAARRGRASAYERMDAPFDRSETDAVTLGGLVDYYEMLGVKVRAGAGEVGGA